ncbi:MAG: hypothetical protein MJE68_21515, partial [Proteobacteria bacterium]|nr:hypothetical protein [Pseudomonadota bacterium]
CTSPFIIRITHWLITTTATHVGCSVPDEVTSSNGNITSTMHNCTAAVPNTVPIKEAVIYSECTTSINNTIIRAGLIV